MWSENCGRDIFDGYMPGASFRTDLFGDELMHHGVKGMKWGVRKQRETSGQRTARALRKVGSTPGIKQVGMAGAKAGSAMSKKRMEKAAAANAKKEAKASAKMDKDWEKNFIKESAPKAMRDLEKNSKFQSELMDIAKDLQKMGLSGRTLNNAYQEKAVDLVNKYLLETASAKSPSGNLQMQMLLINGPMGSVMKPVYGELRKK